MATITEHEEEQIEQANASGSAGGVRARSLAAAQQLGSVGADVRGGGLHGAHARVARRPGDGRGSQGSPGSLRPQDHRSRSRTTSTTSSTQLDQKPAIIGHSFGGLIAQIIAGRGLAAVTVAIDPAPFRGVLPLPFSALKSASPVLGNPANRNRAVPLTYEQFRYAFVNAVSEEQAKELYDEFAVPAAGKALFQAAVGEPQSLDRSEGRHP